MRSSHCRIRRSRDKSRAVGARHKVVGQNVNTVDSGDHVRIARSDSHTSRLVDRRTNQMVVKCQHRTRTTRIRRTTQQQKKVSQSHWCGPATRPGVGANPRRLIIVSSPVRQACQSMHTDQVRGECEPCLHNGRVVPGGPLPLPYAVKQTNTQMNTTHRAEHTHASRHSPTDSKPSAARRARTSEARQR